MQKKQLFKGLSDQSTNKKYTQSHISPGNSESSESQPFKTSVIYANPSALTGNK